MFFFWVKFQAINKDSLCSIASLISPKMMLLQLRPSNYLCQFIHNLPFLEISLLPLQYISSAKLYFFMPYSFNVCKMHNRVLIFFYIAVLDKTYCFIDCKHFPPLHFLLASGHQCTVMWVRYQGSRLRRAVA